MNATHILLVIDVLYTVFAIAGLLLISTYVLEIIASGYYAVLVKKLVLHKVTSYTIIFYADVCGVGADVKAI